MNIKTHTTNNKKIAEILSDDIVLSTVEDALDLIGNLSYQGFERIMIHEKNILPDLFDLKTRIAGDVFQKFSQYQMPLTVVGDFEKYDTKSLHDFIRESNKGKQIHFVATIEEALRRA